MVPVIFPEEALLEVLMQQPSLASPAQKCPAFALYCRGEWLVSRNLPWQAVVLSRPAPPPTLYPIPSHQGDRTTRCGEGIPQGSCLFHKAK